MVRPATSRLEVWSSSQRVVTRSYRARAASGQDATREQDCANQDCDQHGAHDTEPFLVGRRVGNFPLQNVAHRTTPSTIVMPSPVPAGGCGRKIRGNCGTPDAIFEKAGRCSFSVTTTIGS